MPHEVIATEAVRLAKHLVSLGCRIREISRTRNSPSIYIDAIIANQKFVVRVSDHYRKPISRRPAYFVRLDDPTCSTAEPLAHFVRRLSDAS